MPNRSWTFLRSHDVTDHHIFRLRHDLYRFEPSGQEQDFIVIDTVSWVNVVPVTTEGNVVLIRQYRHGIRDVTMEIPGGMMDEGETPEAAAARELREETGYVAEKIRLLARVLPNPAVQNNFFISSPPKAAATRARRSLTPSSPSTFWNGPLMPSPK